MEMMKYNIIGSLLLLLSITGCSKETEWENMNNADGTAIRLLVSTFSDSQTSIDETQVNDIWAYRFTDEQLQEVTGPITPETDGTCYIKLNEMEGTLFVLANASEIEELKKLDPSISTLEDFQALTASTENMTAHGILMSGQTELTENTIKNLNVNMTRSVARIDLESTDKGVEILHVLIKNMAKDGFINVRPTISSPYQTERTEFKKTYDTPFENDKETLLYLCEQPNEGITAEVLVRFNDGLHKMEALLPATIKRNMAYTIHVYGKGDNVSLGITSDGWENGSTTDTEKVPQALVDTISSNLPNSVYVNKTCDSVFIPYMGGDFQLVLNGNPGTSVSINGHINKVTVQSTAVRSLNNVARINVSAEQRMPGSIWEYIHLDLYNERTMTGRVVLAFLPNPTKLEGNIILDETGTCDFGRYVEGELGRLTLPEGKEAFIEVDTDESVWIKLMEDGNSFRILGGWKPNDPKADGRTQEARLVINDKDGSNRETYTIRRVNWGLPVVNIDGTWWCKYNLRGNVNSFEDQISIADDLNLNKTIPEHLASCSDSELLALMGGQYQGGNPNELPLRYAENRFFHEGFKTNVQNWGSIPATQMAPTGYELPDYDDYAFFGWGTNSNIGGVGTRTYQNIKGKNITVSITERDAYFHDGHYGTIAFYDFEYEGNHWTLYGLGHQWNATAGSISRMMIMLATTGSTSSSWYMEGYAQAEKANQNWLKYSAQNSQKTRTIRCIKTPVEYIYN